MKSNTLIYLNGTSSCGKTTISKALHALLPQAVVVSSDDFGEVFEGDMDITDPIYQRINALYENCYAEIKAAKSEEQRHHGFEWLYQTLDNNPLPISHNSDLAMYQHILLLLQTNTTVIVDDLIATPYLFKQFLQTFQKENIRIYLIKIDCGQSELIAREQKRGDRLSGMAVFWGQVAHKDVKYDFEVDSSRLSARDCARAILNFIESNSQPQAFCRNLEACQTLNVQT